MDRDQTSFLSRRRAVADRGATAHERDQCVSCREDVVPRSRHGDDTRCCQYKSTRVTSQELSELLARAVRVREHIVRMATGGGCFIGASLSCADLLVFLYSSVLNVSPATRASADRDYL